MDNDENMKFKITKSSFLGLSSLFEREEIGEITLEPVIDTATQAIYEQNLRNKAFREGIEYGYAEGFHDGRCPERRSRFCQCQ